MVLSSFVSNKKYLYRFMGISSFISAIIISIADFLLEFNKEYGISTEIVETGWVNIANWRFTTSIYLCSFFIPFYIVGFWLLYKVISQTNKNVALVVFTLFSYGVIMGSPLIHGIMSLNAVLYKYGMKNGLNDEFLRQLIQGEITQTILPVFLFHYVITWIVGPIIVFIFIIRGKSVLKRWTAFLNPLVFMIFGFLGLTLIPDIFIYLTPGAINKGNAAMFLLLTIKTWNYKE